MKTTTLIISKYSNCMLHPNLHHDEIKCRCKREECHYTLVSPALLQCWSELRSEMNSPINVTSGFRCQVHNKEVGGMDMSRHTMGMAVDLTHPDIEKLHNKAKYIFDVVIYYKEERFVHCHINYTGSEL